MKFPFDLGHPPWVIRNPHPVLSGLVRMAARHHTGRAPQIALYAHVTQHIGGLPAVTDEAR